MLAEAVIGDNASLAEGKYIAALNNNLIAVNSVISAQSGNGQGDSAQNVRYYPALKQGKAKRWTESPG